MACPGGHGLKFSKITWNCAGGKEEVQETAIMTTTAHPTHIPGCAALTNPVNYTGLCPDRDISELVTRNVFMWMREMDGFPISELDIYKHGWFGDGDSDDDDSNCAEGDGGSTIDCNLSVTVGG
ncbi:hypothetical protein NOF04DRAFT_13801 [Fusarium oxysporum II5]|uniref:Uncharacterized protein n=2 Tax=Fusarium oxysporum species complex TaxID=171631 RepID=X0IX65_FUSO5|nr:uncharacterized protein FOIG_13640 [Fusarium odoratissimum NRRL 54006]EXL93507.1 hypothetical protein FOIG_13640 [Fusarium odoratissimum NRRL 54006]KAK2136026.1 hypothetical protein NOF04DRAFT_13801 [Fusarium oxysporum II5]